MITLAALSRALTAHEPKREPGGASAAVLIPVLESESGLKLLFTKRPETLRAHPGQVSFPGGRIDTSDLDARSAALREIDEELGIAASLLHIIGELDDVVTGTGFTVTPFVAALAAEPKLQANPAEVEDTFYLSLDRLLDERAWRALALTRGGSKHTVWFFDDAPYTLWGATAAMTRQLCDLVR